MVEKIYILLGVILICCLGALLWFRPATVSEKLKSFYSTYPIVKYAGDKQHTARTGFVKLLGAVFIILGFAVLLGVALQVLKLN